MPARPVLSLITDEVSDDLDTALAFARRHRIPLVDIRAVGGRSALLHTDASLTAIAAKVDAAGLRIACFCSPLLKWPRAGSQVPGTANLHGFDPAAMPPERAMRRAFEVATLLGADRIRIFSYFHEPDFDLEDLRGDLTTLLATARATGVTLLMENEHVCNLRTLAELADCRARYDDTRLLGALDLCNQVSAGLGQADGDALRRAGAIAGAVHIKDVDADGRYAPLGQGIVETREALRTILAAAPDGALPICLETHMPERGAEATEQAIGALRAMLPGA